MENLAFSLGQSVSDYVVRHERLREAFELGKVASMLAIGQPLSCKFEMPK